MSEKEFSKHAAPIVLLVLVLVLVLVHGMMSYL